MNNFACYMSLAGFWRTEMLTSSNYVVFYAQVGNEYAAREFAVICAHYARLLYPQLH
jgi:hypothetical protein